MSKYVSRHRGRTYRTPKRLKSKITCNRIPASSVIHEKNISKNLPCTSPTIPPVVPPVAPPKVDYIPDKIDPKNITCTKNAYQRANISVPVVVKPFSFAGPTTTLCNTEPIIKDIRCTGTTDQVCYFTIVQEICVEVPIHFGANASVGLPSVDCLPVSFNKNDCC